MAEDYKPRFSFEITEEEKLRADRLLTTYGLRKTIMKPILNDLLDLIEERGEIVLGVLLSEAAKPRDILPSLSRAERETK